MKRDMDLVRKLLFVIEEHGPNMGGIEIQLDGVSHRDVAEHLKLLGEAGLIEGIDTESFDGADFIPMRLTWSGHDFLSDARDETIWNKAKEKLARVGGVASLETTKAVLAALVKSAIGL